LGLEKRIGKGEFAGGGEGENGGEPREGRQCTQKIPLNSKKLTFINRKAILKANTLPLDAHSSKWIAMRCDPLGRMCFERSGWCEL